MLSPLQTILSLSMKHRLIEPLKELSPACLASPSAFLSLFGEERTGFRWSCAPR
jgi:hypothetical protein